MIEAQQWLSLIKETKGRESNNRFYQYWLSMSRPHVTPHDWIRYHLNCKADEMDRNRHWYLDPTSSVFEESKTRVGVLPQTSPTYTLMLREAGLLPNIQRGETDLEAFYKIEAALEKLFTNKTVYFLPGRAGYEAKFVMKYGAKAGITTNHRYIERAKSALMEYQNDNLAFILDCGIADILSALSTVRPDLRIQQGNNGTSKELIFHQSSLCSPPDIVFSVNMFNDHRVNDSNSKHYIQIDWQTLLWRILATGTTETRFYIAPVHDYKPIFSRKQLLNEIGNMAEVNFYDRRLDGGKSVASSPSDFTFSIRLKKPVPLERLNL